MTRASWLFTLALLPACSPTSSGPPTPPSPAGAVLGYALPTPNTLNYVFHDSSSFEIQGGAMGDIKATIGAQGTADITYAQKPTGLEATVRVTDYAGSMVNSAMGSGLTATEADIQGAAVMNVSPRGATTIVSLPTLTSNVQQVGVSASFFRRFFVRVAGARVTHGSSWVDTIQINEDGPTKVSVTDIVTSTFTRDTIVNGRTLALITTSSQRAVSVSGTNQGMQIAQKLKGTSTGRTLWDVQRNVLFERTETSQLTGGLDLPQMGVSGLPMSARGSGRVAIR